MEPCKEIKELQAIDVHAHFGRFVRGESELVDNWRCGDGQKVVERARLAKTRLTVVSPLKSLLPRGEPDVRGGNAEAAREVERVAGLAQWAVVDPREPKIYQQALAMLESPNCVGIKIHPEEHVYPIKERGGDIFEFAARHGLIVLSHSGQENSMPEDFVPFADEFPEVTLILAHHGCTCDGDPSHQVRAIQAGKHGNIFTDTSSSSNINPGQIEFAVREVGAEKVLYGTDSPLYFAPMHRVRIELAEISDEAKRLILHDNAAGLLGL